MKLAIEKYTLLRDSWPAAGQQVIAQAVITSFDAAFYADHAAWQHDLDTWGVRLQWDPDHDPYGVKQDRRAIQLGLKGASLGHFAKEQINHIEDITDFVHAQKGHVDALLEKKIGIAAA